MYIGDLCGSGRLELTRFYDRILGMKMEVSFGDLMFEVVVLIACLQEIVSGAEIAQGCVGTQLSLRCSEMKFINVTDVVLGDSVGTASSCYIRDNDCIHNANADHTMDVRRRCDGQSSCSVDVIQETIPCGFVSSSNNDFERITYDCLDGPRRSTTATLPRLNSTEDNLFTDENAKRTETENVSVSSAILGIVGVVFLIITIGIVVLVFVVKVRRKKMEQLRSTEAAKTVDGETDGYETIDVNGAHQGISIEKPVSEYCELDAVDRTRVQRDSHYLQLKKRQQVKPTEVDRETDIHVYEVIDKSQRSSLETASTAYCELDAVPIEGVARESVQCGSEYLQLYE